MVKAQTAMAPWNVAAETLRPPVFLSRAEASKELTAGEWRDFMLWQPPPLGIYRHPAGGLTVGRPFQRGR